MKPCYQIRCAVVEDLDLPENNISCNIGKIKYVMILYICIYMNKILKKWLPQQSADPVNNGATIMPTTHESIISPHNEDDYIQIYRGKFLHKMSSVHISIPSLQKHLKVIVFDMDETIGSFGEFVLLHHSLEKCLEKQPFELDQTFFNELLDLYPKFLRYGIMNIFHYLNQKKNFNECYKIYIYTNNKYSPELPRRIHKYIDYKLQTESFIDKLICAFKVGDQIIEPLRTTSDKTHSDFIECAILPKHTEICFIDNTMYSKMKHNKIFYIKPKGYYHKMEWKEIVNMFIESPIYMKYFYAYNRKHISDYLLYNNKNKTSSMAKNSDIHADIQTDIFVYEKLMHYLKEFFSLTTRRPKTKKMKYNLGRFTRKHKPK